MEDAVDCVLDPDRAPQSGAMMAWDTMAVLMAAYESAENNGAAVSVSDLIDGRTFTPEEMPDPTRVTEVFQRA